MKPRTIIIITVIALAIIGAVVYYLLHQGVITPTGTTGTVGTLPSTPNQQFSGTEPAQGRSATGTPEINVTASSSQTFGIITPDPVLSYFVDNQNNVTTIEPSGVIETIVNGQVSIVSSTTIPNIMSASFSYDGKKILIISGDVTSPKTSIFNTASDTWTPSTVSMQDPVWSPNSEQVAYLKNTNPGTESIFTVNLASATSTKVTLVTTLNIEDAVLSWPANNTLVISDKPSAYTVSSAWAWNLSAKTLTPLIYEYAGLESIWSDTTPMTGLVFSGNSGYQGGHLALIASDGSEKALNFTTLASKCVWNGGQLITTTQTSTASTTKKLIITITTSTTPLDLFCAVPRDQDTLQIARLPDEYDQKMLFTADDFYEINVQNGNLTTLFNDQSQTLDASDLSVANNVLFFINRYDQKLYGIRLQ